MQLSIDSKAETNHRDDTVPFATTSILVLSFILLISDVHPITALFTVAIVCLQSFIGLTVLGYKYDSGSCISASTLFLGFFYGTVVHVILDQIFRMSGFRVIVLPFLVGVAIVLKYRELINAARHWIPQKFIKSTLGRTDVQFVSLTLALIPLCQIWSWARNSVIILLLAYLVYSTRFRWVKRKIFFIPTLFMVVIGSRMRPSFWWLPGWGIDEIAIYSRAIYNWGPKSDVLLAGIPFKYQWGGFSWMGLMSHLTMAGDLVFESRTSFVIGVVAIVLAIYAISYELIDDQRKAIITTFIVVASSTTISYPVSYTVLSINYQHISFVSILCWVLLLIRWIKHPTLRSSIELSLVGVICISTKSVHLVPVVVLTCVIAMIAFVKKDRRLLFGASVTVGLSFLYTRFYFPSQSGTGLRPKFADFTRQFGVSPELSSMRSRMIMSVIIVVALSTVGLLIISIPTKSEQLKLIRIPLLVYFSFAVLIALSLGRVSSTELHFLQVFVLIAIVTYASSLTEIFEKFFVQRFLRMTVIAILICFIFLTYVSKTPTVNDEPYVVLLLKVNCGLAIVLIFIRLFMAIAHSRLWTIRIQFQNIMVGLLVAVGVSNYVFTSSTRDIRPINRVAATYQLGQPELRDVANWINQNTSVKSIVASNLFFGEGVSDNCDVPEDYLLDSIVNQALSSNYYTSVALVKRRFLAAGVLYASITYEGDLTGRIRASLRPACYPDEISRKMLQENEVDIYLGYRNSIDASANWHNLGQVVFKNDQYVVISVDHTN
jgi:hypothetical protein